ncbi:MAG: hypothetical protein ACYSR6_07480 [Planctomycetota bacterium]
MIRRAAIAALLVALSAGPAQAEGGLCGCDVVRLCRLCDVCFVLGQRRLLVRQ